MRIHITATAQNNLGEIYAWHREYSKEYADGFHDQIVAHLQHVLTDTPRLGHVYNSDRGLFRLIYKRRYNIYYTINNNDLYILFIVDGRMLFNTELANPDSCLPDDKREDI